jgi:DNA polymerase I-like protein with 3'-5' exonuclease and polymerase domains
MVSSLGCIYHSLADVKSTQAINYPIQASGAAIIKVALIRVANLLGKHKGWRLVSAIHDSISLEVPLADKDMATEILVKNMTFAFKYFISTVNVTVDVDYTMAEEVNYYEQNIV